MAFLSDKVNKKTALIMGILNVTPDSFSDGGRYYSIDSALKLAEQMSREGADIVDIGGESTRPGAQPVSIDEELDRVLPVVEKIRQNMEVAVSVDTSKPEVMTEVLKLGVEMINDVNALQAPGALTILANSQADVCLMHKQGKPETMQKNPSYNNIVAEVKNFLCQRIQACKASGISLERICVDPGFGFGKTLEHNYLLLAHLEQLSSLGVPILSGTSRKSMIGNLCQVPPEQRLAGSLTTAVFALQQGASIVRVHDVAETRQAVEVLNKIQEYAINKEKI